jgi:hypothetical protein
LLQRPPPSSPSGNHRLPRYPRLWFPTSTAAASTYPIAGPAPAPLPEGHPPRCRMERFLAAACASSDRSSTSPSPAAPFAGEPRIHRASPFHSCGGRRLSRPARPGGVHAASSSPGTLPSPLHPTLALPADSMAPPRRFCLHGARRGVCIWIFFLFSYVLNC